ncbi:MAG: riboflavin synthase [Pseudomonadota bacterium]
MFTGIITDVGKIETISDLDQGKRFRVKTRFETDMIDIGASVSHNGVCLTVVEKGPGWIEVEAWEEALRLSTLGTIREGDPVNLEKSLKIGDELGGHLVSGHIDGMADIVEVKEEGEAVRYRLNAPQDLAKFIAPKGSVALDGTSLTINQVSENQFDVLIIKHTLKVTTWQNKVRGDRVNIEVDQMARYAARLSQYDA